MYTKLVNGVATPMTAREVAERRTEEDTRSKDRATINWERRMQMSDSKLPRCVEDIITALDANVRTALAKETLDLYAAKRLLRSQKPTG